MKKLDIEIKRLSAHTLTIRINGNQAIVVRTDEQSVTDVVTAFKKAKAVK